MLCYANGVLPPGFCSPHLVFHCNSHFLSGVASRSAPILAGGVAAGRLVGGGGGGRSGRSNRGRGRGRRGVDIHYCVNSPVGRVGPIVELALLGVDPAAFRIVNDLAIVSRWIMAQGCYTYQVSKPVAMMRKCDEGVVVQNTMVFSSSLHSNTCSCCNDAVVPEGNLPLVVVVILCSVVVELEVTSHLEPVSLGEGASLSVGVGNTAAKVVSEGVKVFSHDERMLYSNDRYVLCAEKACSVLKLDDCECCCEKRNSSRNFGGNAKDNTQSLATTCPWRPQTALLLARRSYGPAHPPQAPVIGLTKDKKSHLVTCQAQTPSRVWQADTAPAQVLECRGR